MKRIICLMLAMVLLLCACSAGSEQQSPETSNVTTAPATVPTTVPETTAPQIIYETPLVAVSMPVSQVDTKAEDGTLICTHATQAFSLILTDADIAQSIMSDFSYRTNSGSNAAKLVHDAAVEDYKGQTDWVAYVYSNLYSPTRLDQSILSLYGTERIFDGSAGSANVQVSVTYDLLSGNVIDEISQVLAPDYSADQLCNLIYEQLAELAADDLLYADYQYTISDMFATNTPVKNWYFSRTGLCFYFMPYELAPHSVGTIVTEIPYSALIGLLQDKFFPAETVDLYGAPVVETYSNDMAFSQIAELTISEQAAEYVLYAEGVLFDVRIGYGQVSSQPTESTEYVFSAVSLGTGDAVVIRCDESTFDQLMISYRIDEGYRTERLADHLKIK